MKKLAALITCIIAVTTMFAAIVTTEHGVFDTEAWGMNANRQAATLISPIHFVSAVHYHPAPGQTITFYDSETGLSYTGVVSSTYDRVPNTDIWIGQLTTEIDSAIRPVNITKGWLKYEQPILSLHKTGATTLSTVDGYQYDYYGYADNFMIKYDDALIASGDSSHPSFVIGDDGSTLLAGAHYRASIGNYALDSSIGLSYDQIVAIVESDGYTVGVPEPSHTALIAGMIALIAFLSRRDK